MSYFVWFGILGLLLLYAAGIMMLLVKKKQMNQLRRYHPLVGGGAAVSLAVHAVWASIAHNGHPLPLFGWVGLLAIAGVYFGYYSILRAQSTGGKKWRQIHWQVELGALIVATVHAVWFLSRILGA